MNKTLILITLSALTAGSYVSAQGLLSLRPQRDEFEKKLPFTVTVNAGAGYDSNLNLSSSDEQDSFYINGGLGLQYAGGDRRTRYSADIGYTGFYYFDAPENQNDYMQNARASLSVSHRVNQRLTISDTLYAAYEFSPNYSIGAGTTRRTDQYFYGYNSLSVAYAWSRKFSTVTSYILTGIDYQEDTLSGESYIEHIAQQQFRYSLSKLTTLVADYRFAVATFDNGFADYTSHYLLAGIDHSFSRKTWGSVRGGVELRDRDNGGSSTNPYFEASIGHQSGKDTSVNAYARIGVEDSSVGSYQDRYSYRFGLTATHRLTPRLSSSAGLHYIHSSFDDSASDASDYDEDIFAISAGLDYLLYRNIFLNASYSFTTSISDNDFREYDRHEIGIGLRAVF